MDLTLYGRVLRRFWWVVVPGVALAFVLALLSFVRVSADGIAYRDPEVWQSQTSAPAYPARVPVGQDGPPLRFCDCTPVRGSVPILEPHRSVFTVRK